MYWSVKNWTERGKSRKTSSYFKQIRFKSLPKLLSIWEIEFKFVVNNAEWRSDTGGGAQSNKSGQSLWNICSKAKESHILNVYEKLNFIKKSFDPWTNSLES